MPSKMPTSNQAYNVANDEIDLFEFAQTLWQEKLLIILFTLICTCAAAVYAFTVQPQYSVSMSLKPAQLSLYGEFVAGMKGEEQKSIALGRSTAEQVLETFATNLELLANQTSHLNDESALDLKVESKSSKEAKPRLQQVTLELRTLQPAGATEKLQHYVEAVSEITLQELNSFVQGLGNPIAITKEMLYTVDAMPSQARLDKPKKPLIIVVGIVLGGMLGIFAALIRSMIRKRKSASE